MLTENASAGAGKFSKYLIYAIGEIFLVVIGILIALQISDWNENRKARITEISILNELISGLEADSSVLSYNIRLHNQAVKSSEIILDVLDSKGAFNDSLARHFASMNNYTTFASAVGPYESLKSMGFETITNKSLRLEIISLYDNGYIVLKNNEKILTEDIHKLKRDYYQDHFEEFQVLTKDPPYYNGKMVPNDFNDLIMNKPFKYVVKTLNTHHSIYNILNKMNVKRVSNLKRKCREEINRLK